MPARMHVKADTRTSEGSSLVFVYEGERTAAGRRTWVCVCDCGETVTAQLSNLVNGHTTSCGCGQGRRTHGEYRHPMYQNWAHARTRCSPEWQADHPSYAGVRMDPRWSSPQGLADHPPQAIAPGEVAPRAWFAGAHLARTADVGDYSPENCRWATPSENAREAVERRMLTLPDGRFALDEARRNGVTDGAFKSRIIKGWSVEDAALVPMRGSAR